MGFLADKGTESCVDFRFDVLLERIDAWCSGGRDEVSYSRHSLERKKNID